MVRTLSVGRGYPRKAVFHLYVYAGLLACVRDVLVICLG